MRVFIFCAGFGTFERALTDGTCPLVCAVCAHVCGHTPSYPSPFRMGIFTFVRARTPDLRRISSLCISLCVSGCGCLSFDLLLFTCFKSIPQILFTTTIKHGKPSQVRPSYHCSFQLTSSQLFTPSPLHAPFRDCRRRRRPRSPRKTSYTNSTTKIENAVSAFSENRRGLVGL